MPEWKYLWSEAFKSRYVLAAHLLKDCRNIIEIGGYMTPITDFLPLDGGFIDSVTVIDPRLREEVRYTHQSNHGNVSVSHHKMLFTKDVVYYPSNPVFRGKHGVALLGLDLHLDEEGWKSLFDLVRRAQRTVIEYAVSFPTGIQQYARILKETGARVVFQAGLDLSGNDFGDLTDSAPLMTDRRIVALECR